MPKSYKVCKVVEFGADKFSEEPLPLKPQYVLPDVPKPPETVIYRARDQAQVQDFEAYVIEHEQEVSVRGRVNEQAFNKFIRRGTMKAFFSPSKDLLLITGRKDDILDFCKTTPCLRHIKLTTIRVDMKALLARLAEVRLVWFRFPAGLIHASALMGSNLQKTGQFAEAQAEGDISTLSFYFEAQGAIHPVMITSDGAVVLQEEYRQIADEIEIALKIKAELLDGIFVEEDIRSSRRLLQK